VHFVLQFRPKFYLLFALVMTKVNKQLSLLYG